MKRFRFRLEKLLAIKKHYEKDWELKLAKTAGECIRIENEMDHNMMEKARTLFSRKLRGPVEVNTLIASELYMQRLTWRNGTLEDELRIKIMEREKVREGYLEASKERKVLDKLKERQSTVFYKEQRNEEMKEIDDMNNSTYAERLIYGGNE